MNRPRLLTAKRAARHLGIAVSTFNRWRRDGLSPTLPDPVETRGSAFFLLEELDGWIDQLKTLRGKPAA